MKVKVTFDVMAEGYFLIGKILINMRILQDPFLVRILLIKVNHGAQDVSLYTHIRGG